MAESKENTSVPTSLSNSRADNDLDSFTQFHDEAYLYITHALNMEEEGEPQGALLLYERALRLIDQALSFPVEGPNKVGAGWEKVGTAQIKMRQTRLQILERLVALRTVRSPSSTELPPSYDEATNPRWSSTSHVNEGTSNTAGPAQSGQSLREKVSEMSCQLEGLDLPTSTQIPTDAESIFTLDEVQLFFVSAEGFVSAPSYPTSLTVFTFVRGENYRSVVSQLDASGWLQVGSWVYPLIPGHSPVLQTNYGAYMFPDTSTLQPGAAVGLLIPDSVEDEVRNVFESILCELTAVRREGSIITKDDILAEKRRLSVQISTGIVKGAELLAKGVGYGAVATTKLVHHGANNLREKINPTNRPADIDPRVETGIRYAREVTGAAVSVSTFVVHKVADATMALGRFMAPHIRRHGANLLSKALKEDPKKVSHKVDDVLEVAAGSLRGFVTIYVSLESAARLLASSLANETVQTVNYRYGCAVGTVTDNAVRTVGNIAMTAYNINTVGVKSIAKRTAKTAGIALVEEFEERQTIPPSNTDIVKKD